MKPADKLSEAGKKLGILKEQVNNTPKGFSDYEKLKSLNLWEKGARFSDIQNLNALSQNTAQEVDAMIQGYEYAYARYLSVKDNVGDEEIANAWLGKAKEMYGLIKSVQNPDEETLLWIKGHSSIMKEGSTLGRTASNVLGCGALILLSALGLGLYALITK